MTNQVGPATGGSIRPWVRRGRATGRRRRRDGGDGRRPSSRRSRERRSSFPSFHGRAVSWTAVTVIMVAFLVGGLALVFGPTWWLFWVALGVAAVGGLMALG